MPRTFWRSPVLCALAVLLLTTAVAAKPPADTTEVVAVFAKTFNGYTRVRLDGSAPKPESYVFARGGRWDAAGPDESIDAMPFSRIIHTISPPLKEQNYVPSFDPGKTDLIIFVYWGTTSGSSAGRFSNTQDNLQSAAAAFKFAPELPVPGTPSAAIRDAMQGELESALVMYEAENVQRHTNNYRNAGILGFRNDLARAFDLPTFTIARDVFDELEANRYFVVLKAFDFPLLWKEKKGRLLWEARYSIREQGNRFDQQLAAMTKFASQFFGQDTHTLVREAVRQGRVEVGTPSVVEEPSEKLKN